MGRGKVWTDEDTAALELAASTGKLADGRLATQERLALALGFTRWTIQRRLKLAGLTLASGVEVMREAGRRGGCRSQYRRRLNQVLAMLGKPRSPRWTR